MAERIPLARCSPVQSSVFFRWFLSHQSAGKASLLGASLLTGKALPHVGSSGACSPTLHLLPPPQPSFLSSLSPVRCKRQTLLSPQWNDFGQAALLYGATLWVLRASLSRAEKSGYGNLGWEQLCLRKQSLFCWLCRNPRSPEYVCIQT